MAHGDYNCCAICDNKQEYNAFDSKTKEEICTDCLKALRAEGLNILDVEELKNWIKTEQPDKVKIILIKVGYHKCFYDNEVDSVIGALG